MNTDLSLCLIVKDEERLLKRCLGHFASLAREIVVLDTGSTDHTIDVASAFEHDNLRVLRSQYFTPTTPREDFNFALARNECIAHASGGWIMSVDADDTISPQSRDRLIRLLTDPNFRLTTADGQQRPLEYFNSFRFAYCSGGCELMTLRLFRNGRGNRYTRAVHEVAATDPPCGFCRDIVVDHRPLPGEDLNAKGEWYLQMLRKELERHPGEPALLFNFAKTLYDMKRWAAAAEAFEPYLGAQPEGEALAWAEVLLGGALFQLDRLDEAEEHARCSIEAFKGHAQPRCLLGDIAAKRQQWHLARQWFAAASAKPLPPNAVLFVNRFYHTTYPERRLKEIEPIIGPFRPGDERTLCLSCGDRHIDGATHVTVDPRGMKLPWAEHTFDRIVADGVVNKYHSPVAVMNAIHELSMDAAEVVIRVPRSPSVAADADPYAKSRWNERTFWHFQRGNVYHETFRETYGINCSFNIRRVRVEDDHVVAQLEAVKSDRSDLVSIIVLNWNTVELTESCIEAIRQHVPHPHEIILIDNGSTEEGTHRLAGIEGVHFIRNAENIGFARGCNQGAELAQGDLVLFLNSDCIADRDFLSPMVSLLLSGPQIGAVGPFSNYASPPQGCYPRDEWTDREDVRLEPGQFLIGFCQLMRRDVFLRLGGFDENFNLGGFEDLDLSRRLDAAGYEKWVCGSAWIHHAGHQTFMRNAIPDPAMDHESHNRTYYLEKYGRAG